MWAVLTGYCLWPHQAGALTCSCASEQKGKSDAGYKCTTALPAHENRVRVTLTTNALLHSDHMRIGWEWLWLQVHRCTPSTWKYDKMHFLDLYLARSFLSLEQKELRIERVGSLELSWCAVRDDNMKTRDGNTSRWVNLNFPEMEPHVLTGSTEQTVRMWAWSWSIFSLFLHWMLFCETKVLPLNYA